MRSSFVIGLAIVLVVGAVAVASADILKGELMLGPTGSVYLPVGDYPITGQSWSDLKDDVRVGYSFGALVDKVVSDRLSVGVDVGYSVSKINTTQFSDLLKRQNQPIEPEFKWKTMQLTGHVRYHLHPAQALSFFGHLGAGLYVNKFSTDYVQRGSGSVTVEVPSSQTFTNFGINAGPGLLVRLSPITRLSLEAIIHNVFTPRQNTRYVNFKVGFVFSLTPE